MKISVNLSQKNISTLIGTCAITKNNVETLSLAGNALKNLTQENFNDCFCGLHNLHELRMSNNMLTDFKFLQGLNNLRTLHMDNNNITQINSRILNTLVSLEKVDLSHNQINNLRHKDFWGNMLPNLNEICLQSNKIIAIHPLSFYQLDSLRKLDLSRNFIKDINRAIFSEIINIEVLNLNSNAISKLKANTFAGLRYLKRLELDENRIHTISKDIFGPTELDSLSYFTIHNNKIKYVPSNLFNNTPNMEYLNLSLNDIENINNIKLPKAIETIHFDHNLIRMLHKDCFATESSDAIMKLKHITIGDNKIYRIHPEAFTKFIMLESLDLSGNMIDELNENIFSNLNNLIILELNSNALVTLPPTIFSNLNKIESIYLFKNKIQRLTAEIFNKNITHSLNYFAIHKNELHEIDSNTFINTPNIKFIFLSHNQIININSIIWPVNLEILNLSHNKITSLQRNAIGNSNGVIANIKILRLDRNRIQNIDPLALSTLQSLEHLNLSFNNIGRLNEGIFNELINLKSLDMSGNDFLSFTQGVFSGLYNLKSLHINENKLITLNGDIFGEQMLEELKTIRIDQNQIVHIESDSFLYTPNVKYLNLAENKIVDISLIVLPINVEIIDLQHNRIRNLVENCFTQSNTSKITKLDLRHNQITNIDPKAFVGFHSLQKIILSNNMIRTINGNTFNHLKNLLKLDLNMNYITALVPGMFQGMGKLVTIWLKGNNIKTIDGDMFGTSTLRSLKYFSIDYNNLQDIVPDTFAMAPNINMDVSNNNLVHIDATKLPANIVGLYINNNGITSLDNVNFVKLNQSSRLKYLRVNNNNISEVKPMAFSGLNELQILLLSFNKIQNLNENTFKDLTNLEILDLHSNLLEYIVAGLFNNLSSLKELIMDKNKIHKITGDMFGEKLPSLSYFTIADNNLNEIDPFVFANTPNIKRMDLSHNNLVTMDANVFSYLTHLSDLNITHNKIRLLSENLFTTVDGLNNLNISYNRLSFLSGIQQYFTKLKNISIHGNPWQCSCLDEILNYATALTVRFKDSSYLHYNGKNPICIVSKICAEDENLVSNNSFVQAFDEAIYNN